MTQKAFIKRKHQSVTIGRKKKEKEEKSKQMLHNCCLFGICAYGIRVCVRVYFFSGFLNNRTKQHQREFHLCRQNISGVLMLILSDADGYFKR